MPSDLEAHLLRKSVGNMAGHRERCAACSRTPLPGELLYVLESAAAVCALCRPTLSGSARESARAERVRAGERRLAVRPLAA
ncbi:MAG: hypothetical protein ACR2NV_09110 [Thermoleophilaceae bacterium]